MTDLARAGNPPTVTGSRPDDRPAPAGAPSYPTAVGAPGAPTAVGAPGAPTAVGAPGALTAVGAPGAPTAVGAPTAPTAVGAQDAGAGGAAGDPASAGVARAAARFERYDPAEAAALLEDVLSSYPDSVEGWVLMARVRLALDQITGALEAAAKAIELAPEDARPLGSASRALTLLGRHEEAITMAYRAVIAEPTNALWHDRVAWSLLAADRQIADAEQAARTAIGLNPHEAHHYFTHGVTLDALGHADQARQAFMISLRLEPENPVAGRRLAILNGEAVEAPAKKRRSWRMFGRRSSDGSQPTRPEEYLP